MVLNRCEAASQCRLELAQIISCLVQEIRNLRETLEFYEVNLISGAVPGTAAPPSLRERLETPPVCESHTLSSLD
jgi:hypothetical protein